MKSVMLSIKPKYCELIISGKKTIEVRKTRPKIEMPFKGQIYCTKGKLALLRDDNDEHERYKFEHWSRADFQEKCGKTLLNSKVIGEFVCDKIDIIVHSGTSNENIRLCFFDYDWTHRPLSNEYLYQTHLTYAELDRYSNGGNLYGWHISDLVIYDEPKELREFGLTRPPQSWCYVEGKVK